MISLLQLLFVSSWLEIDPFNWIPYVQSHAEGTLFQGFQKIISFCNGIWVGFAESGLDAVE